MHHIHDRKLIFYFPILLLSQPPFCHMLGDAFRPFKLAFTLSWNGVP